MHDRPAESAVELIGPFRSTKVCLNGYQVPYLDACPVAGGKVLLTLDDRYMIEVDVADLDRWVNFIANCIAVASGFTAHPGTEGAPNPIPRTPYRRMIGLGTFTEGTSTGFGGDARE